MPFGDSCYSFHANAKTFHEAQELCLKHDKVLLLAAGWGVMIMIMMSRCWWR